MALLVWNMAKFAVKTETTQMVTEPVAKVELLSKKTRPIFPMLMSFYFHFLLFTFGPSNISFPSVPVQRPTYNSFPS